MKKIAVIGASYLQLPLVNKAKEMDLEVHCFAWEEGAVCKNVADFFYPISIIEKERILEICQRVGVDGICTIASDVAAPTVAYVAQKMGLTSNTYNTYNYSGHAGVRNVTPVWVYIPTECIFDMDKKPLDGIGVTPDIEVAYDAALFRDTGKDTQIDRALEYIRTGK